MALLLALALIASPAPLNAPDRVALTLSGGVSLGTYEAGLTWGMVRYLRASDRRAGDLAAVTGASAGGINALMAAAMWCEERVAGRDDDPDANLFHDLWTPVGLEDLLPDDPAAFTPNDGLLSVAPLERALQRLRAHLFSGGLRFEPGCAVSVGLTVTRDPPEERVIAGLRSRRQVFVIPWRFEVDSGGNPAVVSAPLTSGRDSADAQLLLGEPRGEPGIGGLQAAQASLASGAFPFAFRPRQLCDCALRCPEEQLAREGVCEGPDPGQQISGLSCEAVRPPGSRQLCRRTYIDGGIFDNAPIGLTVDLAESTGHGPLPFAPTAYIFVDPDHRRLSPVEERPAQMPLAAPVQLIANLIGTARQTELARATRDERWQLTTQSALSDLADVQGEGAAIQLEMARIAGASDSAMASVSEALLRSPRRETLGPFLLRCLGELRRSLQQGNQLGPELVARCAEPLREGTAGSGEGGRRPSPADIAALASTLALVLASSENQVDRVLAELESVQTPFDRQLQLLAFVQDGSTIARTTSRFLIGEVPSIAGAGLDEGQLLKLRRDLLAVAASAARGVRVTSAMLRVFLVATLLEEETAGFLPPAAATARAALASGFQRGMESAALRQMALASDRVARLMALGARLRTLSARAAEVAASAAQLSSLNAPERRLIISRRFSPLGGAALFNFSGFLDRPLRELDFYAGIYDAAVQFATRECEIQGPYPASGRRAPVFRTDAPLVIDPASEDTQRCLGAALLGVVDALQLRRSPRAMFVLASLSRLELAAQLGSQSAADRLLSESSWTWLGAPALPPGEPLAQVFAAVTLRRAPCHPGAHEALCLVEPNLDELLEALRGAGYPGSSPSMREALSDTDRWTAHFARKLMDRAAALAMSPAAAAPGGRSDVVLTGVGLGQLWARRAHTLFDAPALDLDPSSIPERSAAGATLGSVSAAHLLPYRVTLDVVRGGAAFSWLEPSIRISPAFSIDSVADLLGVDGSGRLATTIGLVPTFRTRALALGAGAQTVLPWNGDRVLLPGLFGRLALVQERMAVTAGVYSLSSGHRDALVSLSVSDLNGLAYWLALWAAGRR